MTREQQFEQHLADWLEEGPFLAPDRPLEAAFAHAEAHPRRRVHLVGAWRGALRRLHLVDLPVGEPLPARIGAFAAVGAAAVLLVGIAGGSAILLTFNPGGPAPGGPAVTESPPPTTAPPASPTPTPAPVAVPPVGATIEGHCVVDDPGTTTTSGNVTRYRGIVHACEVTSSDPRLEGSATILIRVDERADGSADTWGEATIIATDGGTWSGPWRGSLEPAGTAWSTEGFYEGRGANTGLRYRYSQTSEDGLNLRASGTIEAVDALPAAATLVRSETCTTSVFGTQEVVDGVTQYRDMVLSCGSIRSSDPRLAAASERVVINIDKLADGSATMWGTATIENDGGTWSGAWTGTVDVGYTTHRMAGSYAGAGGYAGLEFTYAQIGEQWSPFVLIGTVGPAE